MEENNKFHGLTTTKAPFIENAQKDGQLFIHQPYELYSEDNQEAWKRLYAILFQNGNVSLMANLCKVFAVSV